MTAITFTGLNFTGTADDFDTGAAKSIVTQENDRRALLVPPLPPLAMATGAQLKTSYLELLLERVKQIHLSYIEQVAEESLRADAKQLWRNATDAQRAAAIIALGG